MPVRKVEVERFSLTTSRPFESVVCALKSSIGQLDLAAFASASKSSGTFAELEEVINRNMGESGLMLFLEFDHGAVVRKENPDALKVARELYSKVERLLNNAAVE